MSTWNVYFHFSTLWNCFGSIKALLVCIVLALFIYDAGMNIIMSTEQLDPAEQYCYEAREVAMKELEKHLTEMADLVGYDAVGQAMINAFGYHLDTNKDNIADA